MASSLNHPHICTIHDIGTFGKSPYIVMELLEGETLRSRIAAGPMSVEDFVEGASQIVSAVAAAHARKIVHRDLKPANIFVTRSGVIKVLDFGLAKPVADRDEQATSIDPAGRARAAAGRGAGTRDDSRHGARHDRVHVAGADFRTPRGRAHRRVRARRHLLRSAHGPAAVPGRGPGGGAPADPPEGAAAAHPGECGDPRSPRTARPAVPREGAGTAFPVRGRTACGARGPRKAERTAPGGRGWRGGGAAGRGQLARPARRQPGGPPVRDARHRSRLRVPRRRHRRGPDPRALAGARPSREGPERGPALPRTDDGPRRHRAGNRRRRGGPRRRGEAGLTADGERGVHPLRGRVAALGRPRQGRGGRDPHD